MNTKRGMSIGLFIVTVIIAVAIVSGLYYIVTLINNTPASTSQNQTQNQNNQNPITKATSSIPANVFVTNQPFENPKTYTNKTFGFSFSYPRDFFFQSEGFATDGSWSASFHSSRGDILLAINKGNLFPNEVRMQITPTKIGDKTALVYKTRRDVCDATVVFSNTFNLDSSLGVTFTSCGDKLGSIVQDTDDIAHVLSSFSYTNENSKMFISPKLGFAFRYPLEWGSPAQFDTPPNTTINFSPLLEVVAGPQYDNNQQKLTLDQIIDQNLVGSTTMITTTAGGKTAYLLTVPQLHNPSWQVAYLANKSSTDLIVLTQKVTDPRGLSYVLDSFTFIPTK